MNLLGLPVDDARDGVAQIRKLVIIRYGHHKPRSPLGCAFKTYEPGSKLMTASIESGPETERMLTRPSSGAQKQAAHSAFFMCRSCALLPVPGASSPEKRRISARIRPISGSPNVPLMCNPAESHRQGHRVPPLRKAATINRTLHGKPEHFTVHPHRIHPSPAVLENSKTARNGPLLPTEAHHLAAAS